MKHIGRNIFLAGTFVLSMGLLLNGLEGMSAAAFRIMVVIGVVLQIVGIAFVLKKKEF